MARVANKTWETEDGQYTVTADLGNGLVEFGKKTLTITETEDLIAALQSAVNEVRGN